MRTQVSTVTAAHAIVHSRAPFVVDPSFSRRLRHISPWGLVTPTVTRLELAVHAPRCYGSLFSAVGLGLRE